jgi:hypothetical protein
MSQTSDNSRTFRVLNLTDDVKAKLSELKSNVTQHENINYVEVPTIDDIANVRSLFDQNEIKYKQCSYSTFVRFKDQLTLDQLTSTAKELCENINILYSRVDENNHTGKLVVDRLEDYNILKSNTGDVSFYRFSPVNVSVQTRTVQPANSGGWETQQPRRQKVAGRYTQAAAPAPSRGGRGGGRGGARASRPAPNSA